MFFKIVKPFIRKSDEAILKYKYKIIIILLITSFVNSKWLFIILKGVLSVYTLF